ncbi:MAG TPA: AtpZ/AtpI family protein [Gemmatimonas sp.]|nr:AtpZ/AtpI family protein [Gemmatimonas sp.]
MSDEFRSGGQDKDGPEKSAPGERSPLTLAGLGVQFFGAIVLFVYAGNWMDSRFDTSPLFLLAGLFLGGGGSFYLSYRRLMGSGDRK